MVWTEHVDALGGASADVCISSALCSGEDFTHTRRRMTQANVDDTKYGYCRSHA